MSESIIINELRIMAHTIVPSEGTVILFGSRARGTASDESDWDILIILDKNQITKEDYDSICYPFDKFGWEMNTVINPIVYTRNKWNASKHTLFYKNVMKEGIIL